MEMIDLYAREVGRRLPARMREDIEKEIRSLIEDTLEDESAAQGKPVDEDMVVEVLKRMGSPEKVAASYQPARYLVGPRLFPTYLTTLKIVLSVLSILIALGLGVSLAVASQADVDFGKAVGGAIASLFSSLFNAAAVVTLIFAIVEWTQPNVKFGEAAWDPRKMKPEPDEEQVKPAGLIVETVMNIVAIVVFNLYWQWIGFFNYQDGGWVNVPVLTQAFLTYLPWITLLWSLQATRNIILLAQGRWTNEVRWFSVGLSVLTIALGAWMLAGPALAALDPAVVARLDWPLLRLDMLDRVNEGMNLSVRMVIGIIIAVEAVELVKRLYRLLLKNRVSMVES